MLLITTPDPYALSGHGHCEAGAPGRDIVCAAASCLLDAYAARLQELDIPLRLRQGPGLLRSGPGTFPAASAATSPPPAPPSSPASPASQAATPPASVSL